MTNTNTRFTGSIPETYHRNLGPVLFEPYAAELAGRLLPGEGAQVLELACGTGIVTKRVLEKLPADGSLVAIDLNEAMIEVGRTHLPADDRLTWRVADAMNLPFSDNSFDHVVSQFAVMFFPDKLAAAIEVRRVLKNGGPYLFNVWDAEEKNDLVRTGQEVIHEIFPDDPPTFYTVPTSYHDERLIAATLREAGFREVQITRVPTACRSRSATEAAHGFVYGNPISIELSQRGVGADQVVKKVADRLAARYGEEPMECRMSALVVEAR